MIEILTNLVSLLEGFGNTVLLFVLTLVFSLPLGLGICFLSKAKNAIIRGVARVFISIIRGTPLMLQLIIIFYGPGLVFGPGTGFTDYYIGSFKISGRMIAAVVAFSINYAAYFSEIYRGGIESIPQGQYEAGYVLGLNKNQTFSKVILLQVIKRIVPPIGNEIITLVKDTSIARMIAVVELIDVANDLRKAAGGGLWPLLAAGVFYFVFNALVAFLLRYVEKKLEYIKV